MGWASAACQHRRLGSIVAPGRWLANLCHDNAGPNILDLVLLRYQASARHRARELPEIIALPSELVSFLARLACEIVGTMLPAMGGETRRRGGTNPPSSPMSMVSKM